MIEANTIATQISINISLTLSDSANLNDTIEYR